MYNHFYIAYFSCSFQFGYFFVLVLIVGQCKTLFRWWVHFGGNRLPVIGSQEFLVLLHFLLQFLPIWWLFDFVFWFARLVRAFLFLNFLAVFCYHMRDIVIEMYCEIRESSFEFELKFIESETVFRNWWVGRHGGDVSVTSKHLYGRLALGDRSSEFVVRWKKLWTCFFRGHMSTTTVGVEVSLIRWLQLLTLVMVQSAMKTARPILTIFWSKRLAQAVFTTHWNVHFQFKFQISNPDCARQCLLIFKI